MRQKINEIVRLYEDISRVYELKPGERPQDFCDKDIRDFTKGKLAKMMKSCVQEYITGDIIKIAWHNLGGSPERLDVNSKKIRIPIQKSYVEQIKDKAVREYILKNIDDYHYKLSVDKHVFIDGKFVMAIECKSYAENAMIKRTLVDFHLLKVIHPQISCFLFQLESQLTGDYSALPETVYGSVSTHSIMSYFENVELHIFTLLKGERNIDRPIHKFFKPLKYDNVERAVKLLENYMKAFV